MTEGHAGKKRLIVCCDGTWNKLTAQHPTNVVQFASSIAPYDDQGHPQLVFYDEGVGTGGTITRNIEKFAGGALGVGLMQNVEDAYRFLMFNYEPGDDIVIVGFSRGAYTACQLVGMVRNCGIMRRHDCTQIDEAVKLYKRPGLPGDKKRNTRATGGHPASEDSMNFRKKHCPDIYITEDELSWRKDNGLLPRNGARHYQLQISYVGVWDIVRATTDVSKKLHDQNLSGMVRSARHAVAIDETRSAFKPMLWRNLKDLNSWNAAYSDGTPKFQQVWFPGDHGSVGGGGDIRGLSDEAFKWITEGAERAGVKINMPSDRLAPDYRAELRNVSSSGFSFAKLWPPYVRQMVSEDDRGNIEKIHDRVHWSAAARWNEDPSNLRYHSRRRRKPPYRPKSLRWVQSVLDDLWMPGPGSDG